ncbi:hypothetical protein JOF56_001434 [Kibdelosporangium banguiense]|uniref:DNA-binding protein n=1 Tax=Kibdelosporangium banguiense TaxID=1365924 RepID=A0ABS4T9E7_9PSEU|nr:hypothetical protein [Kibdelosporangium banguiense]MBP2321049.1 hypothetical protein [Kibdelosporangium banguiense]
MFEYECRRAAEEIRTASDRLRKLGRKAAPGVWRVAPGGDTIRVLGRDNQEIAVLTGLWAPSTATYLTAVSPTTAYNLAELMWLSESVVRKGEMPYRLREAMLTLAKGL